MTRWIEINGTPPPENIMLMTKISDDAGERNIRKLCRKGNLWWTETGPGGMYVYYTPTHWRRVEENEK